VWLPQATVMPLALTCPRKPSPQVEILMEWFVACMIAAAVVSAWRGAWVLLDALLLPEALAWSAGVCICGGCAGKLLAMSLQPMLAAFAREHPTWQLLWVCDALYTYFGMWVCVLIWRGVWLSWDFTHLRELPKAGALDPALAIDGCVSHAAGVAMLLVLGALRNLVAAPMLISSDASQPIFGAGATAGIGRLNPITRLRQPPHVQSAEEWHRLVGIPYAPVDIAAGPVSVDVMG